MFIRYSIIDIDITIMAIYGLWIPLVIAGGTIPGLQLPPMDFSEPRR